MNTAKKKTSKKVLAVSSGGGHWIELLRLLPALDRADLCFATVNHSYREQIRDIDGSRFYCIGDVTRWNKIKWIQTGLQILWVLIKERPDVVISTGALPGYIAVRLGKYFGSKTIWVDSIANVEALSTSGQKIANYADLWLTQWEHLSNDNGPEYRGAVI